MTEVYLTDNEVDLLKHDFLSQYGYDFTQYSHASFRRRLQRYFILTQANTFEEFRYRLLRDEAYFEEAVSQISVVVTGMFRDPSFYRTLRESVLPVLATYPLVRIWHAGCATGEEVFSMAILLHEAKLLHKSLLYATDINPGVIEKARQGIFPISVMQQYSANYLASGGSHDFSSYYAANYNYAKFNEELSARIVFATHNLVTDASFNSFQLILCRNVLIYFEKELQTRVLNLFDNSLEPLGFLGLGSKESIRFSDLAKRYTPVVAGEKLWRKSK
ncbi:MAG: protein-glutamate O-methyltransferase CheR [Chitinophagaceae bacterium]|nr:MAG: protein-glutamate O-methyltransferase CheR [Chitinophagaceae bacterium]